MAEGFGQVAFPAQREQLPEIINFVLKKAANFGLPDKRLAHLELAMEEILVNIINYSYEVSPGEIFVETETGSDKFRLSITDNGIHFDPLELQTPDIKAGLQDRPIGGLGVMLMRNIMDEVHYIRDNGQNKTVFVVYKSKA